jgi:hypothetical protein
VPKELLNCGIALLRVYGAVEKDEFHNVAE